MRHIKQIDNILAKTETAVIILVLSVMVLLAFGQVILRNFFGSGIYWADIFLRQMVLWVGFLGASLAVREKKHISIDILPLVLPKSWKIPIRAFTDFAAGVISGFLAYAAWNFIKFEMESDATLLLNIPVWAFQTVLPFSFILISVRFLLQALDGFISCWKPIR